MLFRITLSEDGRRVHCTLSAYGKKTKRINIPRECTPWINDAIVACDVAMTEFGVPYYERERIILICDGDRTMIGCPESRCGVFDGDTVIRRPL